MSEVDLLIHRVRLSRQPKKYRELLPTLELIGEFIKEFLRKHSKKRKKK
jgi:hypothetical protein